MSIKKTLFLSSMAMLSAFGGIKAAEKPNSAEKSAAKVEYVQQSTSKDLTQLSAKVSKYKETIQGSPSFRAQISQALDWLMQTPEGASVLAGAEDDLLFREMTKDELFRMAGTRNQDALEKSCVTGTYLRRTKYNPTPSIVVFAHKDAKTPLSSLLYGTLIMSDQEANGRSARLAGDPPQIDWIINARLKKVETQVKQLVFMHNHYQELQENGTLANSSLLPGIAYYGQLLRAHNGDERAAKTQLVRDIWNFSAVQDEAFKKYISTEQGIQATEIFSLLVRKGTIEDGIYRAGTQGDCQVSNYIKSMGVDLTPAFFRHITSLGSFFNTPKTQSLAQDLANHNPLTLGMQKGATSNGD